MSKQYDNSLSGALFAVRGQPDLLTGTFQFGKKPDNHATVMQLGADGVHVINVHKRGKEGQAVGKALLTVKVKRTATNGALNANGNPTPVARSIEVSGPKADDEMRFCVWKAVSEKVGEFYQLKPDTFEQVALPTL